MKATNGIQSPWARDEHYSAWLDALRTKLEIQGARVDLARWLAAGDEGQVNRWKVALAKILNQGMIPRADVSEAIRAWMGQKPVKRKARTDEAAS